jgi:hypothetical protein
MDLTLLDNGVFVALISGGWVVILAMVEAFLETRAILGVAEGDEISWDGA